MSLLPKIAFFGGEPLGLPALQALVAAGLTPEWVFCNPDRPKGRGQTLHAPPIKTYAQENGLSISQPSSFKNESDFPELTNTEWDLFVVVAYNFILPPWFLALPKHGVLNVHPSLLPKLRGSSPIRTALLENKRDEVGVTVMVLDEKMDHGPILAQELYITDVWPVSGPQLDTALGVAGAMLLVKTIPLWLAGDITPTEQAHENATYTQKITKSQAELTINPYSLPNGVEATKILYKIHALAGNPGTFFLHDTKRIKVTEATLSLVGQLDIKKVIPEGKSEMTFVEYLQSLTK